MRRAVAVFAIVADGEGFVEVAGADHGQHRAEDFFFPNAHLGLHLVDHAGAEQEAVFGQIAAAAVEGHVGAFLFGDVEIAGDAIAVLGRDDRAHVDFGAGIGRADLHLLAGIDQSFDQRIADLPTGTATLPAMQRSPAQPNAEA